MNEFKKYFNKYLSEETEWKVGDKARIDSGLDR